MDKRKIVIVLGVLLIAILVIVFLLIKTGESEKTNIIIVPLENIEEVNLNQVTQQIIDNIPDFSLMDYIIETIIKDSGLSCIKINKPISAVGSIESFKKQLNDTLFYFLKNHLNSNDTINNIEINRRLELLFKSISDTKKDYKNIYVLIGAFNTCYDSSSSVNAINSLKEIFKKELQSNVILFWNPYDPNKYVKNILEEIKTKKNIQLIDKSVEIKYPRTCLDREDTIYIADIVVLSQFKPFEARKITNRILNNLANKAVIRTISMKGTSNHIAISDSLKLDSIIYNALIDTKKNSFVEARTLIIQALNYWEKNSGYVKSKLFLLGNLPEPTESQRERLKLECSEGYDGLLACKKQLEQFRERPYPEFIIHVKGIPPRFNIQSYFIKSFEKAGIKIKTLDVK